MVELKRKIMVSKRKSLPKDRFFENIEDELALTFDDVRLRTGFSEVMPDAVDITTFFSRNVPLQIPFVSAAMDTVTEHQMAIAMAKAGGLGIIHRNLTPEMQAKEVARVKYHLNGKITEPICVNETITISELLQLKEQKDIWWFFKKNFSLFFL